MRGPGGEVLDPTAGQFRRSPPYERGRGRGFLTKRPSKRARKLARKAGIRLNPPNPDSRDVILRKAQRYLASDPGEMRAFLENLGFRDYGFSVVRPEGEWRDEATTSFIYATPEEHERTIEEYRREWEREPWVVHEWDDALFGLPWYRVLKNPMRIHRNPDEELRRLERAAVGGDRRAEAQVYVQEARRARGYERETAERRADLLFSLADLPRHSIPEGLPLSDPWRPRARGGYDMHEAIHAAESWWRVRDRSYDVRRAFPPGSRVLIAGGKHLGIDVSGYSARVLDYTNAGDNGILASLVLDDGTKIYNVSAGYLVGPTGSSTITAASPAGST